MTDYEMQAWIQAIVRWLHVFAGILWVGQTYLFNFLEKNLQGKEDDGKVAGNLWMVHGGGFFYVEKQKFRRQMPTPLHWFKWEAAFTWISGMILLVLVYYMGGILAEPGVDFTLALSTGVGVLVLGGIAYDVLLRSPIGKNEIFFAALSFFLVIGIHYWLSQVLSSRAAFFHIGALFGTIMAANVWLHIIPAQRKIIRTMAEGLEPDMALLAHAPQRSKQNSFMVVPLIFIMISNHYPAISYGNEHSTIILGLILIFGWGAAKLLMGR
jgi:uncharacterized membrane protein